MDEQEMLMRTEEILSLLYANPEHVKLSKLAADIETLAGRLREALETGMRLDD
jgi:hypothetical protein